MATHTGLHRRDTRLARDRRRVMAVHAGDLVLPGMHVVAEEDRLARPLEVAGVTDDRSWITRGSSLTLLAVRDHRREGEDPHHDPNRKQVTPGGLGGLGGFANSQGSRK